MASLICKLWQIAWDMWDHRNEVLYKQNNRAKDINMVDLDKAFRSLYSRAAAKLQRTLDRYLVQQSLRQVLSLPQEFKLEWVKAAIIALKHKKIWLICVGECIVG
jgi:hypothetical protein